MAVAGCKAILAAVALSACCVVDVAHGFSSALSCPVDIFNCLGDDDCGACLNLLQDTGLTLGGVEFELCGELYAGTCVTAESVGCNTENEDLVDLFDCVFEDTFGCDDFTTCEDATAAEAAASASAPPSAAPAATPAPSTATTTTTAVPAAAAPAAPETATPATATPATATSAPAAAPTFPTPVFPLPSAAPTPGSRGGNFLAPSSPTAAPTADGSGAGFGTAFPSPAVFEGTMAPSASSASPTGVVDGLRGGIGSAFSVAPTAAPSSGFEALDDLEDGVDGGASSSVRRTDAGLTAAAWSVALATTTALCGLSSALAAAALAV